MVERKRAAALDAALAAMFRMFERRGVPDHIRRTLDQLHREDEGRLTPYLPCEAVEGQAPPTEL